MLSPLLAFLRLSRVKFLAGGFVGGGLGTALAASTTGVVDVGAYALAQATITAFHLMTHYANDFFDREGDAGARRTPYSGGSGVLVDGSLGPQIALRAAVVCAALGLGGALALVAFAHAPLAAGFAIAIALGAWTYSAPPLRLLARGLGELDTALVVALLVPLCAFAAQRAMPDSRAIASVLPGAAAMFAMMLAVEFPDIEVDAASGKRNLVVRLGPRRAGRIGVASSIAVYGLAALAPFAGAPPLFTLFLFATLPLGIGYARAIAGQNERDGVAAESLAARGVAFFFVVTLFGLLAYAAPLRLLR